MLSNMLNDLAEAMKALDGKKYTGWWGRHVLTLQLGHRFTCPANRPSTTWSTSTACSKKPRAAKIEAWLFERSTSRMPRSWSTLTAAGQMQTNSSRKLALWSSLLVATSTPMRATPSHSWIGDPTGSKDSAEAPLQLRPWRWTLLWTLESFAESFLQKLWSRTMCPLRPGDCQQASWPCWRWPTAAASMTCWWRMAHLQRRKRSGWRSTSVAWRR